MLKDHHFVFVLDRHVDVNAMSTEFWILKDAILMVPW